ncbi:hypothetical protein CHLNCDRAFT_26326 [Chlorella variabilis]|uniref:Uncharacterized protein n=1 Tax=Chlorella variabilis TaxID=554065 RepID=E1ZN68_CHLVA|nr:hypothetical protein CHLNCDRAFT_26326 [Chlorella variabilis]EFN52917.1 hypothetical protein CHLNCDRAFT_26326 [Chlorella variabilis]|eukprot:XP_005845019.1 hypothetical protein CHLNCDRAFT_26326 [Chlorella variabilis]
MLVGWETAANPTGCGHHGSRAHPSIAPCLVSCRAGRRSLAVVAGNKGAGGPFAPIVVVTRNAMGTKEFNQFRGKAISLHSQVIKDFCKQLGADTKQVQGLIRLAKKNGEKLGFLA